MWLFLSSRIRTWLFLAVAVPLVGRVLGVAERAAAKRNPDGRAAKVLHTAGSATARLSSRRGKSRQ